MQDAGMIQTPSSDLDRLKRIEAAATAYIIAQEAVWRHRRAAIDNDKAFRYWMAERDELGDAVETTLVALTEAVRSGRQAA